MKQCLLTFSILFFSALFILTALGMSYGAIEGFRTDDGLLTGIAIISFGPLSLAALAVVASSLKARFDEESYKAMKSIIFVLAVIQSVLMVTYIAVYWIRG